MLSAFVITRDGARTLPAVLANLRAVADEIVVITDAASADDTAQIAAQLADRAEVWEVGGCPEHVRNTAARLCRGDWLLMSDDDELWPPAWQNALPALLTGAAGEYVFPRKHILAGERWITSEPWYPDWQIRLRSREAWARAPWPTLPHATPDAWGRAFVNIPFWHMKFVVQDVETRLARMNRWGELRADATGEHYRKFAMPEEYQWQTAPLDEEAPRELVDILRACAA